MQQAIMQQDIAQDKTRQVTGLSAHPAWVGQFINMYQTLNSQNLHLLADAYASDVVFVDPMHQINGLAALTEYFANLYSNITEIHFDIHDVQVSANGQDASLFWTMRYAHPKLNQGRSICVEGMSRLSHNEKIVSHRDYFDAGQMLYEHVPLLGWAISQLKRRVAP